MAMQTNRGLFRGGKRQRTAKTSRLLAGEEATNAHIPTGVVHGPTPLLDGGGEGGRETTSLGSRILPRDVVFLAQKREERPREPDEQTRKAVCSRVSEKQEKRPGTRGDETETAEYTNL